MILGFVVYDLLIIIVIATKIATVAFGSFAMTGFLISGFRIKCGMTSGRSPMAQVSNRPYDFGQPHGVAPTINNASSAIPKLPSSLLLRRDRQDSH